LFFGIVFELAFVVDVYEVNFIIFCNKVGNNPCTARLAFAFKLLAMRILCMPWPEQQQATQYRRLAHKKPRLMWICNPHPDS
jgi:hypothetical protein